MSVRPEQVEPSSSGPVSPDDFQRRFNTLILLTWTVPPVFGLSFLVYIELFTLTQIWQIVLSPTESLFILGSLVFAYYYFRRYVSPLRRYLEYPGATEAERALECVRRFPLRFWGIFLVYLIIAPSSVMLSAIWYAGMSPTPLDWLRIHLVALIVSIIVGLPIFFLAFDLFGRVIGRIMLKRPYVTIRTKVFLIGSLVPLLIDTLLVQYYWTRTGYFGLDTFIIWVVLEVIAVAGTLLFLRSFGQSLVPLRLLIESDVLVECKGDCLVPKSTDELGVISNQMRKLIEQHWRLEEQLRHSQKVEAIVTLTGGISHEFNNIMTAILGFGEIMQDELEKSHPARNYLDLIISSAMRASQLTSSLLAYSRKQAVEMNHTDINEMLEIVKGYLSNLVSESVSLQVTVSGDNLYVLSDKSQLEQVIVNLASNALAAMPEGGSLTITARHVEFQKPYTTPREHIAPGHYVLVSVADTGLGMSMDVQDKIFEPFFTTKDVGAGTGLGLPVVHGIVKKHNGHIDFESEPGRGTTFNVYLPLIPGKAEQSKAEQQLSQGGTETVLLAEDDEVVREFIVRVLQNAGYRVIESSNGEDAIRKFTEHRDDIRLLLFDVGMPGMSGEEAFDRIREMDSGVKAIFLSGYGDDNIHIERVRKEGYTLISKPVRRDALLSEMRKALE